MYISNESFFPNLPHPWDSGTQGHHPFVLEMIYIDNYCTGFMVLGGNGENNNIINNSVSKKKFFVSFQNITLVC